MEYKVWVQIEEIDEDEDHYQNISEPECLVHTDTLEKAESFVSLLRNSVKQYELAVVWTSGQWNAENFYFAESEKKAHEMFEKDLQDADEPYCHIFTYHVNDLDDLDDYI